MIVKFISVYMLVICLLYSNQYFIESFSLKRYSIRIFNYVYSNGYKHSPLSSFPSISRFDIIFRSNCDYSNQLPPTPPSESSFESNHSNPFHSSLFSLVFTNISSLSLVSTEDYSPTRYLSLFGSSKRQDEVDENKDENKNSNKNSKKSSRPRYGLLLILMPALLSQMRILQQAVPFIVSRLSQYLSPMNMMMSLALQHRQGRMLFNTLLFTSSFIGGVYMIIDTFTLGSSWTPLIPSNDSYALVTGATYGIGYEIAKQLYGRGYNLVLVSNNQTMLSIVKDSIVQNDILKKIVPKQSNSKQPIESDLNELNPVPSFDVPSLDVPSFDIPPEYNIPSFPIPTYPMFTEPIQSNRKKKDLMEKDWMDEKGMKWIGNSWINSKASNRRIHTIVSDMRKHHSASNIVGNLKRNKLLDKIDIVVFHEDTQSLKPYEQDVPFLSSSISSVMNTLDSSISSIVSLTKLLLPPMIARRNRDSNFIDDSMNGPVTSTSLIKYDIPAGRVLFISSSLAFGPSPDQPLQAATKAFLSSFAMSLRQELLHKKILVTLAYPTYTVLFHDVSNHLLDENTIDMNQINKNSENSPTDRFKNPIVTIGKRIGNSIGLGIPSSRNRQKRIAYEQLRAASAIVSAVENGRDSVVPGFMNRIYVHIVCNIFPKPLVATISKMMYRGSQVKKPVKVLIEDPRMEVSSEEYIEVPIPSIESSVEPNMMNVSSGLPNCTPNTNEAEISPDTSIEKQEDNTSTDVNTESNEDTDITSMNTDIDTDMNTVTNTDVPSRGMDIQNTTEDVIEPIIPKVSDNKISIIKPSVGRSLISLPKIDLSKISKGIQYKWNEFWYKPIIDYEKLNFKARLFSFPKLILKPIKFSPIIFFPWNKVSNKKSHGDNNSNSTSSSSSSSVTASESESDIHGTLEQSRSEENDNMDEEVNQNQNEDNDEDKILDEFFGSIDD